MGDVAMLAPVLLAIGTQYPDAQITLLTRKKFGVFFQNIPNITVIEANFEGIHKGLAGLWKLFRELRRKQKFDVVVDVHQNLRTSILKSLFRIAGIPCFTIDKGRDEKKALTRKKDKILKPLQHTVERYAGTFELAGFSVKISNPPYIITEKSQEEHPKGYRIGIAPFAQHAEKMWDFSNFETLLKKIYANFPDAAIFLFGGGKTEIEKLENLHQTFPQSRLIAGKMSLNDELSLIQQLDLMVCMDSGNMHLAAMLDIPVLSIWGATHPFAGFGPYGQSEEHILQIPHEELPCRPCSVFGNKPCWRHDRACLTLITSDMVFERIKALLLKNKS
jgi:ADP-heptose:LPS heptosyltransferase